MRLALNFFTLLLYLVLTAQISHESRLFVSDSTVSTLELFFNQFTKYSQFISASSKEIHEKQTVSFCQNSCNNSSNGMAMLHFALSYQ